MLHFCIALCYTLGLHNTTQKQIRVFVRKELRNMERILKNERRVEGDCKRYLLRYTLVSNGFPKEEGEGIYYGIITEQFVWTDEGERWEAQDTAQVKGFSESLEESMAFFEKMVQGEVMPVSLNEIVDDWKSAFYMGRKESA